MTLGHQGPAHRHPQPQMLHKNRCVLDAFAEHWAGQNFEQRYQGHEHQGHRGQGLIETPTQPHHLVLLER